MEQGLQLMKPRSTCAKIFDLIKIAACAVAGGLFGLFFGLTALQSASLSYSAARIIVISSTIGWMMLGLFIGGLLFSPNHYEDC